MAEAWYQLLVNEFSDELPWSDQACATGGAKVSAALNAEQKRVLEQRGVLSADEVHRLASKTKRAVQADTNKAGCHSDLTDTESAQSLQQQLLG
jgi:phosphomethylpyrimidine synthase